MINSPECDVITFTSHSFLFGSDVISSNNMSLICKHFIWYLRKESKIYNDDYVKNEISIRMYSDKTKLSEIRFRIKWQPLMHLYNRYPEKKNLKIK